ncbi:MAG: hypothetical protein K9G76_03425 [Bacteroidales bacterium]|nr:hypothetical protein [Bacteroidales bacterium]MCF8402844.1 hypothetical protein [Bacteroidales bacterium]
MKKITLISILAIIVLITCKKDENDDNTNPVSPTVYLAEATIGANGGALSAAEFNLVIPPGAFTDINKLKVSKNENIKPFENDQSTPLYTLEGLPDTFSQALTLSIKAAVKSKDEIFLAIGEDNFISSLDTLELAYHLVTGQIESGWYTFEIPAIDADPSKSTNTPEPLYLNLTVVTSYTVVEGPYFRIHTPVSMVSQAEGLLTMLNTAREKLINSPYPMDLSARTEWPVKVTIKKLSSTAYGYYSNSRWGDDHGYLEFNSTHMSNADQLAITAGHEFLHLAQSLYDPRAAIPQAILRPDWHWLNEATAVWIEEKLSNNPDYLSGIRNGHQMAPFNGAEKGGQTEPGYHGYGMASLIKKIDQMYAADGWPPLNQLYGFIREEKKPIDALALIIPQDFPLFYRNFLESLSLGNIYNDIIPSMLVGNASGTFSISSSTDTLKTFPASYPQLSGKLFKVTLNFDEIDDNAYLNATITGGEKSYVSVFKYKSSQIELIGGGADACTVMHLKQLKTDGWQLLVLVTNKNAASPYILSDNFDLNLRVKDPDINLPPYLSFVLWVDAYTKWDYLDTVYYEPLGWLKWQWFPQGAYNGELYISTWDTVDQDNWLWKGSVAIDIDFENQKINWISVQDMMFTGTVKDSISFTVIDVPMVVWEDNHKEFKIDAAGIEEHITSLYYKRTAYGNSLDLLDFNCNNNCRLEVVMDDDNIW